jgi:MarR family transcriptional regulator, organic hydroperoxide resistance regulator
MSSLREVFNELVRLEIEIWNAVDARLREDHDLPLTHFEPMSVIDRMGICRVYDIASELGITTGGTSKLVDRIEEQGLLRRRPNPNDRRSSLLELTPAGRKLVKAAGRSFDDELELRLGKALGRGIDEMATTLAALRISAKQLDALGETA